MRSEHLRQAALGLPSLIADENTRNYLLEVFGNTPTLVMQVADGNFDAVANCEPGRQMFSAALRTTAQGCTTVVLVFQFDALQLRCVISLSHPGFLPLLRHAQATGCINVVMGNEAGEECGTMRPPFHEPDVAALLSAVGAVPKNSAELFLADAVVTAAECWDADALPSMFTDVVVERADVSVVLAPKLGASSGGGSTTVKGGDLTEAPSAWRGGPVSVH